MDVTQEVELIGPGFKRQVTGSARMGYWTPELARWSDINGFEKKDILIDKSYLSGILVTGTTVNASPVVVILHSHVAETDLIIEWTGNTGIPSGEIQVLSGTEWKTITGFSKSHQYGIDVYHRTWCTGGDIASGTITLPAHSIPGKVWLLPNKRIYEITEVKCSRQRINQPLTNVSFYALADNGSKLLYGMNWDNTFENLRTMLFGNFGAPKVCPTCAGSGTISGSTCLQCNEYGFSGWNSTGYLLTKKAKSVGIMEPSGGCSIEELTDKIWTKTWWVTPTKKSIQRYFAHFAGITTGEVEVTYNLRTAGPTGVESIVDIYLPYTIPLSRFNTTDRIWSDMAKNVEPAGIKVRFSFIAEGGFTGTFDFEDRVSVYRSGYIGGVLTGQLIDPQGYGFDDNYFSPSVEPFRQHGWYQEWGATFLYYNFQSGHVSGDDAVSGYVNYLGTTFESGLLTGNDWMTWAVPETGLIHGDIWPTGETAGITQEDLWVSGVFYNDNFWGSGANAEGCQF